VSSTKIRKALEEGDMTTANMYLGYNYMLTGSIIRGKGLGRKLDFPTANLSIPEEYKLIPKNGVYVVSSAMDDKTVFGMMNIGYNPTVEGKEKSIEINFFDFDRDLYGKRIQVDVIERIRDEQKFSSIEALKAQLKKDRETSLSIITS
jgi:riboflavin kinase/FMN adenylyltransferase